MNMLLRRRLYNFDEFCALLKDGQKADLIDGVIYMASPDSFETNELNGWLYILLAVFVARKKLGKVCVSRVAFRLGERGGPEPDIGFVKKSRQHKVKRGYVEDGRYFEVSARNGIYRSKVVKGFWLQESWLWSNPRPDPLDTIELLLND
jgi:Uma2 family endonuclease